MSGATKPRLIQPGRSGVLSELFASRLRDLPQIRVHFQFVVQLFQTGGIQEDYIVGLPGCQQASRLCVAAPHASVTVRRNRDDALTTHLKHAIISMLEETNQCRCAS